MPPRKFHIDGKSSYFTLDVSGEWKSPVPEEYDYVARRTQYPWLLRKYHAKFWPEADLSEFFSALARAFGRNPPTLIVKPKGYTQAFHPGGDNPDGLIEIGPGCRKKGGVPVGVLVHEYAHIEQWHWWERMSSSTGNPKWEPHKTAFVDALDRVAIEAAKLLR